VLEELSIIGEIRRLFRSACILDPLTLGGENASRGEHERGVDGNEWNNFFQQYDDDKKWDESEKWVRRETLLDGEKPHFLASSRYVRINLCSQRVTGLPSVLTLDFIAATCCLLVLIIFRPLP
jgi:hypothetical protein